MGEARKKLTAQARSQWLQGVIRLGIDFLFPFDQMQ
jgi:hypothetical protein